MKHQPKYLTAIDEHRALRKKIIIDCLLLVVTLAAGAGIAFLMMTQ